MKDSSITIRLDRDLDRLLARVSRRVGRSRSALARESLRRQLLVMEFDALRESVLRAAEGSGLVTDEDAFDTVT